MSKAINHEMYVRILRLIMDGESQPMICKYLKISRQNLNFYIGKLRLWGFIRSQDGGAITLNEITDKGKEYIINKTCKSDLRGSHETFTDQADLGHFDNIHDLSFIFNIREYAEIWMPNEKQLNNDVKVRSDMFGDTRITIFYGKNNKAVSLQMQIRIKADDPHEATWRAYQKVMAFAEYLYKTVGITLGYPVMNRKPHYTIIGDAAVNEISKRMIIHTDKGHIDRSHDTGEMEYYTPERAKQYIQMPEILESLNAKVDQSIQTDAQMITAINKLAESNISLKDAIMQGMGLQTPKSPNTAQMQSIDSKNDNSSMYW